MVGANGGGGRQRGIVATVVADGDSWWQPDANGGGLRQSTATGGRRWQLAMVDCGNGQLTRLMEKRKNVCEARRK